MKGADLTLANIRGADLRIANLTAATLRGIKADSSILVEASLTGANLDYGKFREANFNGADFYNVDAADVQMNSASAAQACMDSIYVERATFRKADLSNSSIRDAMLWHVIFDNANLLGVDFSRSRFWGGSFKNADLAFTNFKNTELEGFEIRDDRLIFRNGDDSASVVMRGDRFLFALSNSEDAELVESQSSRLMTRFCRAQSLFQIEPKIVSRATQEVCPKKVNWRIVPDGTGWAYVYSAPSGRILGDAVDRISACDNRQSSSDLPVVGDEFESPFTSNNFQIPIRLERDGTVSSMKLWGRYPIDRIRNSLPPSPDSVDGSGLFDYE
jgi:uncharacterized protein YjbI with pentapeptide repeats